MTVSSGDTRAGAPTSIRAGRWLRRRTTGVPPTGLVLTAILSVQLGSGVATHLFSTVGSAGAALLRVGLGAVILLAVWRPRLRGYDRRTYALAALFGLTTATMNFSFYSALDRIPLGIAVTLEFIGPLGVAVAGSRRKLDLLWALLAAAGIALLAPWGGVTLDALGILFALLAGVCWGTYIHLSARVGQRVAGGGGLALAMTVGGIALVPVGVVGAGVHLLEPRVLLIGLAVALLSAVIPYSCELEALRSLPTRTFGILMSLEPVVAAIIGFVLLGQVLGLRALAALILVTIASYGGARSSKISAVA